MTSSWVLSAACLVSQACAAPFLHQHTVADVLAEVDLQRINHRLCKRW